MSSLRDDVSSRAYASASGDLRVCRCADCDSRPGPPCAICGTDCVPLDDLCRCPECQPIGEETSAEWEARVAPRRPA